MESVSQNFGGWPAQHASAQPGQLAVADAQHRLDYAAFEDRCARCAAWLASAGVVRGDRVAVLLGNRSAYLETVFAAARLGAMSVPVNVRWAPREIAYLLDDCTPRVLLHETSLAGSVDKALAAASHRPSVRLASDDYDACLERHAPRHEIAAVAADDPAILMYTSGTTGMPKGALLPHRKTLFNSLNAQLFFELEARDRVLVVVPLFHSFGLQILSIPTLYAGGSVILQPRFEPDAVWSAVEEHGISFFGGVPTMFRRLWERLDALPKDHFDLSSLRFLFTAGSAIPVELIRNFENRGLVLKQGFGQTETSILCCLDARDAIRKAGSVGQPVFHSELRLVCPDTVEGPTDAWRDCAPGEVGEIVVRGPITMLGYWNRPEDTAATLRDDWLRTHDLATRDEEGFYTLAGRSRELIISGGENVYPSEVEQTFEEHADVREVAVVGIPDDDWGEVGRAYLVLQEGVALDSEALRNWARERLASFKVPREFVAVDALPRTETGKIQKFKLTSG